MTITMAPMIQMMLRMARPSAEAEERQDGDHYDDQADDVDDVVHGSGRFSVSLTEPSGRKPRRAYQAPAAGSG